MGQNHQVFNKEEDYVKKDAKPKGTGDEFAKNTSRKLRDALRSGDVVDLQNIIAVVMGKFFPQSVTAFPVNHVPGDDLAGSSQIFSPEQEKTEKLYANIATNIWRIKNHILDEEGKKDGVLKEQLDERAIAKISRYINSLETAMANGGIEVVGDYEGKPHREGSAVKVVSYEDRQDLKEDTYIEVLMPTVRWTNAEGKTRLLQPAEVVIGRPKAANA